MKIILKVDSTKTDSYGDTIRKSDTKTLKTINSALKILWKLKKPRFASISLQPEDIEEKKLVGFNKLITCKRNQRRGIHSSIVMSKDELNMLPRLHESTRREWRQLPNKFNKLMEELIKKMNGVEDEPEETGNAYDDLGIEKNIEPLLKKKKKKTKAKKKKSTKKKGTKDSNAENIFIMPPIKPVPIEADDDEYDMFFGEDDINEDG